MKIQFIPAALCCALLAGCASTWSKPGGSTADLQNDRVACEYEAKKATGSAVMGTTADAAMVGWRQGEIEQLCMRNKGYSRQ